jgi:hypothetical protein
MPRSVGGSSGVGASGASSTALVAAVQRAGSSSSSSEEEDSDDGAGGAAAGAAAAGGGSSSSSRRGGVRGPSAPPSGAPPLQPRMNADTRAACTGILVALRRDKWTAHPGDDTAGDLPIKLSVTEPFETGADALMRAHPRYRAAVAHGLDFATIDAKLAGGAYPSPAAFAADVRLLLVTNVDALAGGTGPDPYAEMAARGWREFKRLFATRLPGHALPTASAHYGSRRGLVAPPHRAAPDGLRRLPPLAPISAAELLATTLEEHRAASAVFAGSSLQAPPAPTQAAATVAAAAATGGRGVGASGSGGASFQDGGSDDDGRGDPGSPDPLPPSLPPSSLSLSLSAGPGSNEVDDDNGDDVRGGGGGGGSGGGGGGGGGWGRSSSSSAAAGVSAAAASSRRRARSAYEAASASSSAAAGSVDEAPGFPPSRRRRLAAPFSTSAAEGGRGGTGAGDSDGNDDDDDDDDGGTVVTSTPPSTSTRTQQALAHRHRQPAGGVSLSSSSSSAAASAPAAGASAGAGSAAASLSSSSAAAAAVTAAAPSAADLARLPFGTLADIAFGSQSTRFRDAARGALATLKEHPYAPLFMRSILGGDAESDSAALYAPVAARVPALAPQQPYNEADRATWTPCLHYGLARVLVLDVKAGGRYATVAALDADVIAILQRAVDVHTHPAWGNATAHAAGAANDDATSAQQAADAAVAAAGRASQIGAAARKLLAYWRELLLEAFGPFTRALAPRVAPARLARDAALLHRRVTPSSRVVLEDILNDLMETSAGKACARPLSEMREAGGVAAGGSSAALKAAASTYADLFRRLGAGGVNAFAVGGGLVRLGDAVKYDLVATYGDFVAAVYITAGAVATIMESRLPASPFARRLVTAAADAPARFRHVWHRYSVVLADLVLVADAEAGYSNDAAGAAAAAAAEAGEVARFATGVFGACRPVLDARFK